MKHGSLLASVALALGVALVPASAQAQAPGVTKDEITLGTWITTTGPVAIYGVPIKAGADSFINELNAKGGVKGRKIKWIVDDNAYNPQQTVTVARKLITRDNVFAIPSAHGTAQTAAAFPYVLDEAKVPILMPYAGAKEWYTPPRPGLLGLHVLYEDQAEELGRWAGRDGHKKVLVVHGAHAAFENVANYVQPGLKAVNNSGEVEKMAVKIGTTDYAPIALEIARKKPDAIVMIQLQQEIALLAKGLKQQGASIAMYTYGPNIAKSTIELGGEFVEGLKSVSLTSSPDADTPAAAEYRAALAKHAPSEKPDFASYIAWGTLKIMAEALNRAPEPLTRESLLQGFYALKGYDSGVFPPVEFSATAPLGGNLLQPMIVKNGKWENAGAIVDVRKK
jgi:branched-chain amino acid transport system substrate-binding protein